MSVLRPLGDRLQAIALGWIPNATQYLVFGRNTDVDASSAAEDVWDGGGTYTGHPTGAAETLAVASASAADTAAGTGARTLRISGLDASGAVQTETVTLNGTSTVTTSGSWTRVHEVVVATAGSGGTNAGAITVNHSATTANVFAVVAAETGAAQVCAFTVPAGRTALLTKVWVGASSSSLLSLSDEDVTAALAVREAGTGAWRHLRTAHLLTSRTYEETFTGGLVLPAQADVKVRIIDGSSNNMVAFAAMEFFTFAA